ncbi:MAG: hypothetical protein RIT43_1325 [Bacteroidota bacterium]
MFRPHRTLKIENGTADQHQALRKTPFGASFFFSPQSHTGNLSIFWEQNERYAAIGSTIGGAVQVAKPHRNDRTLFRRQKNTWFPDRYF